MEKILPINTDPCMRAYTQHGYLHAIISTPDKVCYHESDYAAEISVSDYDNYSWSSESENLKISDNTDNHIVFSADKWNHGMNAAIYRDCGLNDRIQITIHKQLYSNAWSNISLFVAPKDTSDICKLNSHDTIVGNFSKDGIFYSNQKRFHNRIKSGLQLPLTLTLVREKENISFMYSNDSHISDWIPVTKLCSDDADYQIGLIVNLGNSMYYEWMFSNYIQLFGNSDEIIPIDFIVNWHKDWCVHTANHLVDYNHIKQTDLARMNMSLLEYVKMQIDLDCYVEIEINDNMKWGIADEKYGPYFHQNLIYGYSDETQRLFVLYYDRGNISTSEIPYSDFESPRNQKGSRTIYSMRYNPCYEKFELSAKRLLNVFQEYKDNNNISYFDSFYEDDGYLTGSACYKQYTFKDLLQKTSLDFRFAHLLYERASCNINRVEYLQSVGLIDESACNQMIELLKNQQTQLLLVRNLIFKNQRIGKIDLEKLHQHMLSAYESDAKFTDMIIDCLKEKIS